METGHWNEAIASGLYEDGSTIVDGKLRPRILARCACCPKVVTRGAPLNLPLQAMDRWIGHQSWRIMTGEPIERRYICPHCVKHHRKPQASTTLAVMEQALTEAAERKRAHMSTAVVPVAPLVVSAPPNTPIILRLSVSGKHTEKRLWYQLRIAKAFVDTLPSSKVMFYLTADKRLVLVFGTEGASCSPMSDRFYLVRPARQQDIVITRRLPCYHIAATYDGVRVITDEPLPLEFHPLSMPSYPPAKEPPMQAFVHTPKAAPITANGSGAKAAAEPVVQHGSIDDKTAAQRADVKTAIAILNDAMAAVGDEVTLKLVDNRVTATRRVVRIEEVGL